VSAAVAPDWPGRADVLDAIEAVAGVLRLDDDAEAQAVALAMAALAPLAKVPPLAPQAVRLAVVARAAAGAVVPHHVLGELLSARALNPSLPGVVRTQAANCCPAYAGLIETRFGYGIRWAAQP
jgi:hypothetical protein